MLYLAYFGPGLLKIGLTAVERERDRLLEQGALTFVVLATGPYGAIRRAERRVSATRLATERLTAKTKAAAWRTLPPKTERIAALSAARGRVAGHVLWPDDISFRSDDPIDQAGDFGLEEKLSESWQEVTQISDSAVVSGEIRAVIGRHLLLDTAAGLLLCDMRRAAGWTIHPLAARCVAPSGLVLSAGPELGGIDECQESLF